MEIIVLERGPSCSDKGRYLGFPLFCLEPRQPLDGQTRKVLQGLQKQFPASFGFWIVALLKFHQDLLLPDNPCLVIPHDLLSERHRGGSRPMIHSAGSFSERFDNELQEHTIFGYVSISI
jgi:hypothetical protein